MKSLEIKVIIIIDVCTGTLQAIAGDDSHLHLLSSDSACKRTLNLWEKSYTALVSHDLVSQSEGLELVVASQDGTILCLGQTPIGTEISGKETEELDRSLTWPSETRSHNDFTYLPFKVRLVTLFKLQ